MIIDLSKPRKEYFKRQTSREILLRHIHKEGPITLNNLGELTQKGKVITGTKEDNLEKLLALDYKLDNFSLVEKIKHLNKDELLVLPPDYRIPIKESRELTAYSDCSFIDLDSEEVRKAVLKDKAPPRRLTQNQKEEYCWDQEKVISAAFALLHQNKEKHINKTYLGYMWTGLDRSLRIVPIMEAIEGAELRAFQNLAYYKQKWPEDKKKMEKELAEGINLETGKELTASEKEARETRLRRYSSHLQTAREGCSLQHYVSQSQVRKRDMIRRSKNPFNRGRGRNFKVPSRNNIYGEHNVKAINIPLLYHNTPQRFSLVWEIIGECTCSSSNYQSDRRRSKEGSRRKEYCFCPHIIASLLGLKSEYDRKKTKKRIHSLPFLIQTKELMDYVDVLRYQTILLDYNPETKRFSKRVLNSTEIGNLVMKKFIADGYEANATTDIDKLKRERYDIMDLIKFKE